MQTVTATTSSISSSGSPTLGINSVACIEEGSLTEIEENLPQQSDHISSMLNEIEGLPRVNLGELLGYSSSTDDHGKGLAKMLVAVTNAESIVEVFPQWVRRAYLSSKCYRPYDLNMPPMVPGRTREALRMDSPLTEFGKVCSSIAARDLLNSNIFPDRIFCSPELRSVETAESMAAKIFEQNSKRIPTLVEPALCEWRNFDESGTEKHWMTTDQFKQLGYLVNDGGYKPVRPIQYLATEETPEQYFDRLVEIGKHIVDNYSGCSVVIGSTGLASLMNSQGWKNGKDLHNIRAVTPSCSIVVKCVPICKHETFAHHTKLRPFTRTLIEAKRKRLSAVKK